MGFAEIKLGLLTAWTLAVMLGAAVITHKVDNARYEALELKYKTAEAEGLKAAAAEQAKIDEIARQAAQADAEGQRQLADSLRVQLAEVPVHVSVKRIPCVSYGFIRVLDAAVLRTTASGLRLPAGGADDACAPVTADTVAKSVVENFGACNANADQLDRLIGVNRKFMKEKK